MQKWGFLKNIINIDTFFASDDGQDDNKKKNSLVEVGSSSAAQVSSNTLDSDNTFFDEKDISMSDMQGLSNLENSLTSKPSVKH